MQRVIEEKHFLPNVSLNLLVRSVALRLTTTGMNGLKYIFSAEGDGGKRFFTKCFIEFLR